MFNGAFMELLTTDMPLILSRFRRVFYWGDPHVRMDLTAMGDVAEYTAHVALDDQAPRYLRIAGDTVSAADVRAIASREAGETYRLFRAGGIGRLNRLIGITRFFAPGEHSLYPAWQGMQVHARHDARPRGAAGTRQRSLPGPRLDFGGGVSQIPGPRIGLTTLSRSARASRDPRTDPCRGRRHHSRRQCQGHGNARGSPFAGRSVALSATRVQVKTSSQRAKAWTS